MIDTYVQYWAWLCYYEKSYHQMQVTWEKNGMCKNLILLFYFKKVNRLINSAPNKTKVQK